MGKSGKWKEKAKAKRGGIIFMLSNIADVKKMIVQKFNNRTNDSMRGKIDFSKNEDVLDAIARTYMYYANNFPDKIDASKIAGADRFRRVLNQTTPDNMADLYLGRLLLNMLEIGQTKESKGLTEDNGIYFDKSSMDRQIHYWKQNDIFFGENIDILKGNESRVTKNLNDKVVIHELSHMSAIAGIAGSAGFYEGIHSKSKQTYASRLEEICAEATALNVTHQKIPAMQKIKSGNYEIKLGGYNPESSNYAISSFIELAPFAFGKKGLETGRLIDPEAYMKELNSKYSAFARDGGTFAGRIQEDLKAITDNKEYNRLAKLQADFIKIGMNRITNPNYLKTCDELQFKQDVGFMLRLDNLLFRMYENSQLKSTENVVIYDSAMKSIEDMFNYMKANRNMFAKYNSFEDFKAEGLAVIANVQRKSLGLEPINNKSQQQTQQAGETASNANVTGQMQTHTMGFKPTPPPKITPTLMHNSRNLEDKIKFLQSLTFETKKMTDFAQELSENIGQTREDLSCAYAIINGSRNNVADLRYTEIEKTLFEMATMPDYNRAKSLFVDYCTVLNKAGYVPSYGTLGRALQEMDKIDSSNLDNKGVRKDFLRNALGTGNSMLKDSESICKYIKFSNNIFTPMTHDEQSKVLLKMQENYNQFGLQPQSNKPKNYNKLINANNLPKGNNIRLEQKSTQEIEAETNLYRGYHNYTSKVCQYSITNENGEQQDIWNVPATEIINKLVIAINSGDKNEIRKMRIICENMQGHFTPSYNDMAKLTMVINDYWKLSNNADIDRAIESLRDMSKDKYREGLTIAKFNAQKEGRCQATYSEMVNVFKDLEAQKNLSKQSENQGYGGGM